MLLTGITWVLMFFMGIYRNGFLIKSKTMLLFPQVCWTRHFKSVSPKHHSLIDIYGVAGSSVTSRLRNFLLNSYLIFYYYYYYYYFVVASRVVLGVPGWKMSTKDVQVPESVNTSPYMAKTLCKCDLGFWNGGNYSGLSSWSDVIIRVL